MSDTVKVVIEIPETEEEIKRRYRNASRNNADSN